jgi:hypothetical protein
VSPSRSRAAGRAWALAALLLAAAPAAAHAQIFVASRANPGFTIGPLFVQANVTPQLGHVAVNVLWSVVVPPTVSPTAIEQDLYLLWPGAVVADPKIGPPDPALARDITGRGFTVIDEGRIPLGARLLFQQGPRQPMELLKGGAPFVTFVREGGPMGLTAPATWIRIPWTPRMVNRAMIMDLKLTTRGLIKDKPATWLEHAFWGERHRLSLSFMEVRQRAMFPMYYMHRDRVVKLADDPAQLIVNFADNEHLKIDELFPQSVKRQVHETRESTDTLSLYIDRSEGITPQTLTVQFGYFTGLQSWAPVLIPAAFFILGNLAAPLLQAFAKKAGKSMKSRFDVGRRPDDAIGRDRGVVLTRETLAHLVPGETTYEQVLALCGPDPEEHEDLSTPGQKTLIYRGQRLVPQRRRIFSWLATVSSWAIEQHAVEIRLANDRVVDVQARVRRTRLTTPEGTATT